MIELLAGFITGFGIYAIAFTIITHAYSGGN